jgi:excisionase family DNA binding protein
VRDTTPFVSNPARKILMSRFPASPSQPPRALLSSAQAAAYLNVSVNTLRRYVADGLLTNRRVGPRLLKYDPAELEAFTRRGGDA